MSENDIYKPSKVVSDAAFFKNMDQYKEMYQRSIDDPDAFWAAEADKFFWFKKWDCVRKYNYNVNDGPISIEWFKASGKTQTLENIFTVLHRYT